MSHGWSSVSSCHAQSLRWLCLPLFWLAIAGFAHAQNYANTPNNLVANGDFEDTSVQATNPGDNPGYPIPSWTIGGASSINLIEVDGTVGNQAGCAGGVQCGPDNDADPATSIPGTIQHYVGIDLGSLDASESLGMSQEFTLLCDTTVTYGGWYATRNEQNGYDGYIALIPPGLVSFLDVNVVTLAAGDSNTWTNFEKRFALSAGTYELFTQIDPNLAVDDLYVIPDDPCIHLSKTVTGVTTALGTDPAMTDAGDTISYDLVVENTSPASAMTNVTVVDPVATTLACPSTSVAAGASMTCTASYVIASSDLTAGFVENSATVTTDTPSANGAGASDVSDDNGDETVETPDAAGVMDGDPTNDPTVVFLESTPTIQLMKTVDTVTVAAGSDVLNPDAGDTVTYAFTVTNQGLVPLTNIVVTDPMLGAVTCALTTLNPGDSTSCTAGAYTVLASDVANGYVQNSAVVSSEDPLAVIVSDDSDAGNDSVETADGSGMVDGDATNDPTVLALTSSAGLRLYKTIGATTIGGGLDATVTDAGDTVTFNFTVTNTLSDTVTAIAVTDALLGPVSCAATTLNAGASTTCTAAAYTVLQADVDAGFIQNSASVSGMDSASANVTDDSDAGDDSVETADATGVTDGDATNDPTFLVLNQSAQIRLYKTITNVTANLGFDSVNTDAQDEITYDFEVTNTGSVTLTNVDVIDLMLGTIVCATTTLAPGASTNCSGPTYVIQYADMDAGYVDNSAAVTATDPDNKTVQDLSDAGDNATETGDGLGNTDGDATNDPTVQTLTQLPAIRVYKTIDSVTTALGTDPAVTDAGDTISYLFEVTNVGNVTIQQLAVTDSLVPGITCNFTAVGVYGSTNCSGAPYTITAADVANGYVENTATGQAEDPETNIVLDISDAGDDDVETADGAGTTDGDSTNDPTIYTFAPLPSIRLYKTIASSTVAAGADPANVDAGDTITYSFELTNTGSDTLTGIAISDPLLGTVTCAATTLAAAAQTTCTAAPYTILAADVTAGYVENSATVSASDSSSGTVMDTSDAGDDGTETADGAGALDGDTSNDPTVFPITAMGDIRLYKTVSAVSIAAGADPAITDAGDSITYTFTLENTGPVDLDSIVVTDPMLGGINCTLTALTVGQSTTCNAAPYTILAADVTAGYVENSATVTALDPVDEVVADVSDAGDDAVESVDGAGGTDGDPSNDPTVQTIVTPGSIRLYKVITAITDTLGSDPLLIDAGDTITYEFTVENTGGESLMNITITDAMLGTVTCATTSLAPGLSTTCTAAPYTILQADVDAGYVENSANVSALDSNSMPVSDVSDAGNDGVETADGTGATDSDPTNDPTVEDISAFGDIQLTKTVGTVTTTNGIDPSIVDAGDTITYVLTVENVGIVTLSSVSVSDPVIDPVTCTPTTLAPGQTANCIGSAYTISQWEINSFPEIENSANASALDGKNQPVSDVSDAGDETVETPGRDGYTDSDPTNDPTLYTVNQIRSLRLYKTIASVNPTNGINPGGIDAGDEIYYEFVVTNTGNVTLLDVQITDPLVLVTGCNESILDPGQSVSCFADTDYIITQADALAGYVENSATVTANDPEDVPVSDVSDAGDDAVETADGMGATDGDSTNDPTVQVIPFYAAVQLYKTIGTVTTSLGADPAITDAGDTISYDFVVTNTGTDTLVNITVGDPLIGAVTCAATTLAPQAQTTCTALPFTILAADVAAGYIENQASVNAQNAAMDDFVFDDSDAGNDAIETADGDGTTNGDPTDDYTVFAFTPQPDVRLYKTISAATVAQGSNATVVDAGDTITYAFTVENTGATVLNAIAVTDPLLGSVSCAATTLAVGNSTTCSAAPYTITAADALAGFVENSATVNAIDAGSIPVVDVSDAGDDTTETADGSGATDADPTNDPTVQTIPLYAEMQLYKTLGTVTTTLGADTGITDAGDTISYDFTVTNTGTEDLINLTVSDPLLGTVTCTVTTLAPQDQTTCTAPAYTILATDVAAGFVENQAVANAQKASNTDPVSDDSDAGDDAAETADGSGATNGDPTDDPTVFAFTPQPDVRLYKTISAVSVAQGSNATVTDAGDTITYAFTVTNTGATVLNSIAVTDPLLGSISCMATTLAVGDSTTCSAAPYTITSTDALAGYVENSATVNATDSGSMPVSDVSDAGDDAAETADGSGATDGDPTNDPTVQSVPLFADVQLYKTVGTVTTTLGADTGITDAGDTISYDFLVTNTGTEGLVNLAVSDSMLGTVTCAVTTLAPQAQTTCSGPVYTILASDVISGFVENQATVTAQNASTTDPLSDDSDAGNDAVETADGSGATNGDPTDDPTVFAFTPQPDVRLYKAVSAVTVLSGSDPAVTDAGDTVTYTFTVTNTGSTVLTSIVLSDPMLGSINCAATTLAIGDSTTCSALPYTITAADMDAGHIENSAGVTVQDANSSIAMDISDAGDDSVETADANGATDGDGTNDPTVQTLTASPGLRLTKQVTAVSTALGADAFIMDAGDTVSYSFSLTNSGNVSVSALAVTDAQLGAVTCATTTLAAGATTSCNAAPYTISAADVSAGFVENSATANALAANGDPVSDVSDAGDETTETPNGAGATDGDPTNDPTVQEIAGAEYDLALIKTLASDQPAWVLTNDVIDYEILVQNQGNVPSRTFTVVDAIPDGMSYVAGSATGPGFSCTHDGSASGGQVACIYTPPTANDLAPGATTNITLSLEIVDMTLATFVNWAEITADSAADYGVTDLDSAPGDHGAQDNGPGGGADGANPVIDHDDISHSDGAWNEPSEDEDDSDPATVYSAASTPVTLQTFRATNNGDDHVAVRWRTSMEEANVGYHVFGRVDSRWVRLNARLIAANADAENGANYAHRFDRKGATEYVLADVDVKGKVTPHGPFVAGRLYGFEESDDVPLGVAAASSAEATDPDVQLDNLADDMAHLIVRKTGIQRVTYEQLRRTGLDLRGVPVRKLAIHAGEHELPIWVGTAEGVPVTRGAFRPGHLIEFHADVAETKYRRSLVHRLSVGDGAGLRAETEATPSRPRASQGAMREHVWSPDRAYSRVAPGDDPWYAFRLTAAGENVSRRVVLNLDNVQSGAKRDAVLKVKLWGASDDPDVAVDHNVAIKFNNLQYTTDTFAGMTSREIEMVIAPEIVQNGRNIVEISASSDGHTSAIAVESISLTYAGTTTLVKGNATLTGSAAGYRFRNVASDDLVVWRIDSAGHTRVTPFAISRARGRFDLEVAASAEQDARHVVALPAAIHRPGVRRAPVVGDLSQGPAEYLIVSHPRFLKPGGSLERLIRRREADGLSVKTVNVNWIYGALSGGNVDAEAIREYISWAKENLGTRYALLVGGDTYDYKKNLRNQEGQIAQSLIPSLYGKTADIINHAPVDPLFGDVDSDGVPDVAVGRFPVQTEAELLTLVRKTIQYTKATYGETALFLADNVDAGSQRSFADDAEALAAKLPESWQASVVDLQSASPSTLRSSTVAAVNRGVALTTWIGHSGQNTWSFNRVLRSADIAGLANPGRPTVVAQFGCWNSYHVDPRRRTMAHHWLLQPERGAAAVMGASTLTDATAEGLLSDALFQILARENLTLGEALIKAKRVLAENHPIDRVRDILSGYQLLGDPAMRLPATSDNP